MHDFISREDAEQAKCEFLNENGEYAKGWNDCNREFRKNILEIPSADVHPVVHGEWNKAYADHEAFGVRPFYRYCSKCNEASVYQYNFCPNCGANMKGGK